MKFAAVSQADPETVAAVHRVLHRGLALGAAAAVGRLGLEALTPSQSPKIPFVSPGPSNVPIDVPEQPVKKPLKKSAESLIERAMHHGAKALANTAESFSNAVGATQLLGQPSDAANKWWMTPLSLGIPAVGLVGGYKLMDSVLDRRRKQLANQDVDEARKEYADALSGTSKLAQAVDSLADELLKTAGTAAEAANSLGGIWATGMLAAALGGGAVGHHLATRGTEPRLLNKALKERARRMWAAGQQPIHFVPNEPTKTANLLAVGTKAREHVPKKDFAIPGKKPKGSGDQKTKGSYPMPDAQHARSALGFAAMHHGKDSEIYRRILAKARSLGYAKSASGPYEGMGQLAHYTFAPVQKRRELTPAEQTEVAEGQSQWFPHLFQNYSTKPSEMMASPLRQGLLAGGAGALFGGALGATVGGRKGGLPGALLGGGIGALGLGGVAGLSAGYGRQAENRNLEELMRRLPEGATKRDLESDPAYQADLDRENLLEAARYQAQQNHHVAHLGPLTGVVL